MAAARTPRPDGQSPALATLGGGCFWCLEAVFERVEGVERVVSGYSGGTTPDPTYRQVCGGGTGHAEVVQIAFDPGRVSFRELLEIYFTIHDPTTPDRQGADVGTQYRSIILTHDAEQERTAREVMREVEERGEWERPLVTELVPFEVFTPAEEEHQGYFRRRPEQGYCRAVIAPKVAKLRQLWQPKLRA